MKTKDMIIAAMLLVCSVVNAQETNLEQAFQTELKTKNEQVTSIKCEFTQTREISFVAQPVNKDGEFYFLKPNNMLLSFNDGDYIKMTEEWFEMKTAENITTTKNSSSPMLRNLNSILSACIVGDFNKMSRGFCVNYGQTDAEWTVTLTPQRGKVASKVSRIIIVFDRQDMSLDLLRMEEKTGDYTAYSFSNKQFNIAMDTHIFNITK